MQFFDKNGNINPLVGFILNALIAAFGKKP